MTDWKCLSYWNGSAWADMSNATPVFSAGTNPNVAVAANTSASYTTMTFTVARSCSLAIMISGLYWAGGGTTQAIQQRVLRDGSGTIAQQLGGIAEQNYFVSNSVSGSTSVGVAIPAIHTWTGVTPGTHTIGLGIDVGDITSDSIRFRGAKTLAFIANLGTNNNL